MRMMPGPLGGGRTRPRRKTNAALIFPQNLDGVHQIDDNNENNNQAGNANTHHCEASLSKELLQQECRRHGPNAAYPRSAR